MYFGLNKARCSDEEQLVFALGVCAKLPPAFPPHCCILVLEWCPTSRASVDIKEHFGWHLRVAARVQRRKGPPFRFACVPFRTT